MRMSTLFFSSLRQIPSDAQVISHKLMLRANFITKLASGIYTYLPLGQRVMQKIARIIQEEMNKKNAQEILMPMVQPLELWKESGRASLYGPELLKFQDRKDTWFCLGPTHEEVVSTLVKNQIHSYKQLPVTLYQIQTKFRDEIRPRFGLMRGREFIMKDAYSFCADKASQEKIYQEMSDAYHKIFKRCGLNFRAVKADSGSIGGDMSHEFQVLASSGEDAIASCTKCEYAANVELAQVANQKIQANHPALNPLEKLSTPNIKTIEELAKFLKVSQQNLIKTLAFKADEEVVLVLLKGHHMLSESKLKKYLGVNQLAMLEEAEAKQHVGEPGFLGPINTKTAVKIYLDNALETHESFFAGSNEQDTHLKNISPLRDIKGEFSDFRAATKDDLCQECGGAYEILRGIEVGHIFYLGQKYSKAMNVTVQNDDKENVFLEMGCYGIGVGRTMAAAIEQNHDDKGIIWPKSISPYHIHLVSLVNDNELIEKADKIYEKLLEHGFEVLYDDRNERAGVKFNDADLIGCPLRINLGKKSLSDNKMELILRSNQSKDDVTFLDVNDDYCQKLQDLFQTL